MTGALHSPFARHLDALANWREGVERRLLQLVQALRAPQLLDAEGGDLLESLRRQLATDRVVLAFVAEFSRGKTELINAIFFADTGRRILPASPGRTTMCPVEIGSQPGHAPMLALLPIHTRTLPHSLDELRRRTELWTRIPLDPQDPERVAETLTELMRTKAVAVDEARALGLWDDERPDDNPPLVAEGLVEVPSWRHAVVNYPHPLLDRGLVVLDTPGLNSIGAEASLTLSLLPAAHAAVFVVAADAGVTRSDLAIWRDHLDTQEMARHVVLNKVDVLADPLLPADEIAAQVERQRDGVAAALAIEPVRVHAVSARQALLARIDGDAQAEADSGLPAFEEALAAGLLPHRHAALVNLLLESSAPLEQRLLRGLHDRRVQAAAQLVELRALRGRSQARVQLLLQRLADDAADFERSAVRTTALRAVHAKMLKAALAKLSIDRLRDDIAQLQHDIAESTLRLGARRLLGHLCQRLRERVFVAGQRNDEIRTMLQASFDQLNREFGFALVLPAPPSLEPTLAELRAIERNFGGYLGLTNALRLADTRYLEQFRRLLWARLRAAFESAIADLEHWSREASAQVDAQQQARRHAFAKRRSALERIRAATDDLEQRIAEVEIHEATLRQHIALVQGQFGALREHVQRAPEPAAALPTPRPPRAEPPTLTLVVPPPRTGTA